MKCLVFKCNESYEFGITFLFQNDWLIEMSEGLPSKDGTNIEDNENSDNEYKSINPPVLNKKKSLKQRRKQKEQQALEKARNALKLEKKKITDIHKIKQLREHVEKLEKNQQLSNEKRKKKLKLKKNKTKMLGPLKFEEPEVDFHMAQEIPGNLKNLKAEGNLLLDRFKSLQKRNVVAPTKRQIHKKPKVKRYTKPGHKDEDWKKTVAR